jgi:hypothetical protein
MSHTVTAKVSYAYPKGEGSPLAKTVVKAGGTVLGEGTHSLYQNKEKGFGFTLPGWRYPIVLKENGELKFDDYRGSWGDTRDLDRLKSIYGVEAARQQAEELGWMVQDQAGGGIQIFHPSGGMISVTAEGTIDANNFVGTSCAEATKDIVAAMGGASLDVKKPEWEQESANVRTQQQP